MNLPLVLTSPSALRSVTLWRPGESPQEVDLDQAASDGVVRWFDLASGGDAAELIASLGPLCDGLTQEMLEDLLSPDTRPEEARWADGRIRLASTFAVYPTQTKDGRGNWSCPVPSADLLYQPVEMISDTDWLVTCWHPTEAYSGWERVGETGEPRGHEEVERSVGKHWQSHGASSATAADLGVLVMHELALTYAPAARQLYAALEEWERDLYKDVQGDLTKLTVDPTMVNQLWQARSRLWDWVNPLNIPGVNDDLDKAWLPATDHDHVKAVDKHVDHALIDLAKLGETLRASFHSLQLLKAEAHRDRIEARQRRIEVLAAVFLIPTLIVGFYGSNTWIPGQQRQWGFWVMIVVIILLTYIGTRALLTLRSRDEVRGSSFFMRKVAEEEDSQPPRVGD